MKYFIFIITSLLLIVSGCKETNTKAISKEVKTTEKWVSLFNGKDLSGWIVKINGYPLGENIHNTFRVADSVMKVSYDGYEKFGEAYGHIFYHKPFSSYKLRLQYRFVGEQPPDGQEWAKKNSGIMLHAQSPESMELNQGFPVSLEAQFLGGIEEGVERPTGNLCTPGMHVKIKDTLATQHCISANAPTFYDEKWVNAEVLVIRDSLITHTINGKEVIRYSQPVYGGEYMPETEFWKAKEGLAVKKGYIALQSESHPIEFRNIEILELQNK